MSKPIKNKLKSFVFSCKNNRFKKNSVIIMLQQHYPQWECQQHSDSAYSRVADNFGK